MHEESILYKNFIVKTVNKNKIKTEDYGRWDDIRPMAAAFGSDEVYMPFLANYYQVILHNEAG